MVRALGSERGETDKACYLRRAFAGQKRRLEKTWLQRAIGNAIETGEAM